MVVVPAGKRGSHSDFALSESELQELVNYCTDRRTKAMVLLASLGVPVRGIVHFKSVDIEPGFLHVEGMDPIPLNPKQEQFLRLFPQGFNVTGVTVWRRIKRLVLAAGEDGIITFDENHVPYPAALAFKAPEPTLTPTQMVAWCLDRVHSLQSRIPQADFGTVHRCPHKDCEKLRQWLTRKKE